MKHTKTPWSFNKEIGHIEAAEGQVGLAKMLNNDESDWWEDQHLYEEDIANAYHIVKCVNAHDALIDSLQEIVEHLESIADAEGMNIKDHPVYQRAKQAIEAAGERV